MYIKMILFGQAMNKRFGATDLSPPKQNWSLTRMRLCISILGKAQKDSQTAKTKHKTAGVQGAKSGTAF